MKIVDDMESYVAKFPNHKNRLSQSGGFGGSEACCINIQESFLV
jgi:hypothetical protein